MKVMDLDLKINPVMPRNKDFKIGCIGAGFIMRDCHLVAYRSAGFNPWAITSLIREESEQVAKLHNIPNIYDTWQELVDDKDIEILDIAIPPDKQLEVVSYAVTRKHIKGILCQKPLAMNIEEAKEIVTLCENAGIKLGVNSNMRYDQSIRALKAIFDEGLLGDRVLATIDMRAIPHWQEFLRKYDRIEILNMGIHHIDSFRYLFGDPKSITCVTRKDPRTQFNHIDGISQYTFKYDDDFMATSLDDVWAWPGEGAEKDFYIRWRVEGTEGMAKGAISWFNYPVLTPSTIEFTTKKYPGQWFCPSWSKVWFPDAFAGTMAQLLRAVEDNTEPEIGGRDNLKTIACVDACYESIAQQKTIQFTDMLKRI
jgi:predicted dehydrogenase